MRFPSLLSPLAAIPAYDRFRLETYRQRAVNRAAITILDGEGWVAFRFDQVGYFNYVDGLQPAEAEALLPELRAFYRHCPHRFRFHFEVASIDEEAFRSLRRSGFEPVSRFVRLRHTTAPFAEDPLVAFEGLEPVRLGQADALFRLYLDAFGAPRENWAEAIANMRLLLADSRLRAWWVREGSEPVAFGMLFSGESVPVLCAGATRRDRRNRGLQRTLIRQRLAHAVEMGAEACLSWASSGSVSANNLRREGFEVVDEIWEWASPPPSVGTGSK